MDTRPGPSRDDGYLSNAAFQHDTVQRSPLVRVVAIGRAVEDEGIVLELIALEIRVAGAVLHWRAHPVGAHVLGGPDFVVTDDAHTVYTLLPPTWVAGGGLVRGDSHLVPPPPLDARTMRIEVRTIGGLGRMVPPGLVSDEPVEGRWTFEFDLDQGRQRVGGGRRSS